MASQYIKFWFPAPPSIGFVKKFLRAGGEGIALIPSNPTRATQRNFQFAFPQFFDIIIVID
jgi:hypothetical protein